MRITRVILGLLVCVLESGTLYAKRPVTEVERLQRAVQRQPGDMDKHCELVQAQLAAGDTAEAEKSLDYALKMRETPCLYMQQAMIGVAKGEYFTAARYGAQAVKAGLRPSEDSMVFRIDSLSGGGVMLCLQRMTGEEKQNGNVWRGLGQMAQMKGDTIARGMGAIARMKGDSTAALGYYERAFHLGDSTAQDAIAGLRSDKDTLTRENSTHAAITQMGLSEKKEVKGKINGLAIRMTIDTTATQSTISGVETRFMLKNGYLTKEDIIDNIIVVIKRLEVEGLEIRDIRLRYVATQESPVVLCPKDLKK